MTDIPSLKPYPALKPLDSGYPANIPAGLPTELEAAPPLLVHGAASACTTTVSAVLAANNRTLLASYLAATPLGQQVLNGSAQATILAPPDESLAQTLAAAENGLTGPKAPATLALYHVLQGTHPLSQLGQTSGLWWNTSLTEAACPTASQTVTLMTVQQGAEFGSSIMFARSTTNTVRVITGDLLGCSSVVHLVDRALQPCCTSLFEQLQAFSVVKIQPSYFDGYAAQDPVANSDSFNRRLFEEAMVDFLLFTSSLNETHTLLWPAPSAWDNINLANLLPSVNVDVTARTRAMRLLALYSISYAQAILPQDIPGADGTAPAIRFPFSTALRNNTATSMWTCSDTLSVTAPAWSSPVWNGSLTLPGTLPSPSPVLPGTQPASPVPAVSPVASTSPSAQQVSASPSPAPAAAPASSSQSPAPAGNSPSPAPSMPGSQVKNPGEQLQQPPATRRRLQGKQSQDWLPRALGLDGQQGLRRLQAAAAGPSKAVNVVDTHETCEGIRVLVVDAVPVPCNFAGLMTHYDAIQVRMDNAFVQRDYKSLDAAFYDWLVRNGIIQPGQKVSQAGSPASSSAGSGMSGLQHRLQTWVGMLVLAWFSWQYLVV